MQLLSNGSQTALLNKLTIDGELLGGMPSPVTFREQGRNIITGVPSYDNNQRRFEPTKVLKEAAEGYSADSPRRF